MTEYEEEFGIALDPCEHASLDGAGFGRWRCAACGVLLEATEVDGVTYYEQIGGQE